MTATKTTTPITTPTTSMLDEVPVEPAAPLAFASTPVVLLVVGENEGAGERPGVGALVGACVVGNADGAEVGVLVLLVLTGAALDKACVDGAAVGSTDFTGFVQPRPSLGRRRARRLAPPSWGKN